MKVLFVASEAAPFVKSGGLGDVIGSLPSAISKRGCETTAVIPLHENIPSEYKEKMTYIKNIFVPVAWRSQYCGIFKYEENGVTWYFLDNEYYFKRGNALYGCFDDAERYAFFCSAVLEILPHIDFKPDIIHCHDWQTALVPIYYKLKYWDRDGYHGIKTVFTIHNIEYQGVFGMEIVEDVLGISEREFQNGFIEHDGAVNLMKAAIICSDRLTTVSPTYADEIKTAEFAHGLDSVLRQEAGKLSGIINGIDEDTYNPKTDKRLFCNFSKASLKGKSKNKNELLGIVNLPQNLETPLIGMVTRLVSHKGLDIVSQAIDELLSLDVSLVILGTGEWKYEQFLREKQWQYPYKLSVNIAFSGDFAQKIYAGSDMFLMPSKSEPCGLAQMIALKYGTIPIVRETGRLRDSVIPYNKFTGEGNGFSFSDYNAHDMMHVIREAIELYRNRDAWKALVVSGMSCDFSCDRSATKYIEMYEALLG